MSGQNKTSSTGSRGVSLAKRSQGPPPGENPRYDSVIPPWGRPQDTSIMGSPYGGRPPRGNIPQYDPPFSIGGNQSGVRPDKQGCMYWCRVASKNVDGLGWGE